MQAVTRYKADDGSEWDTADKCKFRDDVIELVRAAMSGLKATPTECNWRGYVQQSPTEILDCKRRLFAIANTKGILSWWIDRQISEHGASERKLIEETHPSWFGRMLDGSCEPLERAYGRLCAIDSHGREWNQPYYAMNPGTGEAKCVG